jgi:hypothetical protein
MSTGVHATRRREEEAVLLNQQAFLKQHNTKQKQVRAADPLDMIRKVLAGYIFVPQSYRLKTKSSNYNKMLMEVVRAHCGKYPVCYTIGTAWDVEEKISYDRSRFNRPAEYECVLKFTTNSKESFVNQLDMKLDPREVYKCVASGGSLYKELMKGILTKREVHTFVTCKYQLNFIEGFIYSIAKTFAENDGVALRIARSKLNRKSLSYLVTHIEAIKETIYFFARNPVNSLDELDEILDYVNNRINHHYQANTKFSLAGYTLASLKKKVQDWHWALARVKKLGDAKWDGAPFPDEVMEVNEFKWYFHQILTTKELAAEGTAMHHCVYSYKQQCVRGESYIWSLSKQDEVGVISRKVTIELDNDGKIVQVRGKANRNPRPEECNVIRRWATKNGLHWSY